MDYDTGSETDLADGAMRAVEVGGRKLLLTRLGGRCHAVGATCPHAGAPLHEGVLRDDVVICPWHKAAFQVTTGRRVEPPAVDDLPSFPARVVDGRIVVSVDDEPGINPASTRAEVEARCMVIVGSGAAGTAAAQALREEGFGGRLVLIGREDRLPYDRTILSKYTLSGQKGGEKTPLQDEAFYDRHRIERRAGEVTLVDPAARTLTFTDGEILVFNAALLATGGRPRPLDIPGHDLAGVHLLRTAGDAEAIVRTAARAKRAVVIGAGYIGLEAAGSLRERGLEVAVVAPQGAPLEKQLGAEIGNVFRRVHERKGVVFHLGQEVAALERGSRVQGVRLTDGTVLPADLVVAGLGIVPETDFVRGLPRGKDGGLETDARLRVADGLYAAGDIAAFPLYGRGERIRVEHWRVAEQHGRVAALNMLGRDTVFDAVPYFWTIHYKQRLDYVGHAEVWDEMVVDGDLDKPEFLAFYIQNAAVQAIAGWQRDRQMASVIGLMAARKDWPVSELRQALRRS
jgi:NADPH-dependent 2,4-dienoyl-CoA reductase/sulfur reductase-like enzyme/nitrite reductase/ring-hydroxylating ferredoxin subunit